MKISIVAPFFSSTIDSYVCERVHWFIEEIKHEAGRAEIILVDQGSPELVSTPLSKHCSESEIKYINLNQGHLPFSAAKCRNAGAQQARGEFLLFMDIDLFADKIVFDQIHEKLNLDANFNHLEIIPCLYLTPSGSDTILKTPTGSRTKLAYQAYLDGNNHFIKSVAPATSSLLLRRLFYLSQGGTREEFFGHGYEDFELTNRLADQSNTFYRSHDYLTHTHTYSSVEYKGYRTYFSLFGRQNLGERIFFIHLFHEPVRDPGYARSSARNRLLFESFTKRYLENFDAPPAISNPNIGESILAIGGRDTFSFKAIRVAIPHLGKIIYRNENDFDTAENFKEYVEKKQINKVFFLNPYGNEKRLSLYQKCRNQGIPYIVFDRGALPDSWFFDANGFNADSATYSPAHWNADLSTEQTYACEKYLHELCSNDKTLEENGPRRGSYALKKQLGIQDKKVLFIPFQRPTDSVVKYFSGRVSGSEEFILKIISLACILPPEWVIISKQHPLETREINIPGLIALRHDTHIYDAIEAADAVALINSGVGLLSLCFGKPVYCFGESFYAHEGLAEKVSTPEDLLQLLMKNKTPNRSAVLKFINHLTSRVYSFGETIYKKIEGEDGSSQNSAVAIRFNELRLPGREPIIMRWRSTPNPTTSPLYDYYRTYLSARRKSDEPTISKDPNKLHSQNPSVTPLDQNQPVEKSTTTTTIKNRRARKLLKLIRTPRLYLIDAISNRLN